MGKNLFDKIWDAHKVGISDEGRDLIALDRVFLHDLCGTFSFQMLNSNEVTPLRPQAVFASPDHTLPTRKGRTVNDCESCRLFLPKLEAGCEKYGIKLFDMGDPNQGIVHVVGPESGLTLPGMVIACGDSHTCTHGAMGVIGMGVGTSEVYHALATSCLFVKRPKTMRIHYTGMPKAQDVGAMDVILYTIAKLGIKAGVGYAVEYTGEFISKLPQEDRFTLCNLTIELGAEYGIISPDDTTLQYAKDREYAPKKDWEAFETYAREMASDPDSDYDRKIDIDITDVTRMVSWGINPGQTIPICGTIPEGEEYKKAYEYTGLKAGQPIAGTKVDYVFVGSCSNGRLSNIAKVVETVRGKHISEHVKAFVVPGSEQVKKQAEELGYDKILEEAGFVWGEPCCGLCVGSNEELIPEGKRCISTTNRNFVGRQGRGSRTNLASPKTAAMCALAGEIV